MENLPKCCVEPTGRRRPQTSKFPRRAASCGPDSVVTMPSVHKRRLGSNPNAPCIRFELTGEPTPIHSPALVDLVGRVPGAPLE